MREGKARSVFRQSRRVLLLEAKYSSSWMPPSTSAMSNSMFARPASAFAPGALGVDSDSVLACASRRSWCRTDRCSPFTFRFDIAYGSVTCSGDATYTATIPVLAKDTVLTHLADPAAQRIDSARWHTWAGEGFTGDVVTGADLQYTAVN